MLLQRVLRRMWGADIYLWRYTIWMELGKVVGPRRLQPPVHLSWRIFGEECLVESPSPDSGPGDWLVPTI